MFPSYDAVCVLLKTPFSQLDDVDKEEFLCLQRPTPMLNVNKTVDDKGKATSGRMKFKNVWYDQYQWLCASDYLQKLFCWPCLLISNKHSVWNRIGFDEFLNVTRSLHKHEGSLEHLKCTVSLKRLLMNSRNTIPDALEENNRMCIIKFNEKVQLNRRFMELVIDAVLYLGKQELPFRSHGANIGSSNRSNFNELLKILVNRSPTDIQIHYENIKETFLGQSERIQTEIVNCISDYIQETVAQEIKAACFFSVQMDDTTYIVHKSQSSIILRYVSRGKLLERFIAFYDVSDRTVETLFNLIHCALKRYHHRSKLIAQCYDGSSVMPEHLNHLQVLIKKSASQAVIVHGLAHHLSFVLQQSVNQIFKCRIFFASINRFFSFFHQERGLMADSVIRRRILSAMDTNWSSNTNILNIVWSEWDGLKQLFGEIINDPCSDETSIVQSEGFLNKFNNFDFTFLVLVFNQIFDLSNTLSKEIQINSLNISYCLSQITFVCEKLQSMRNEDNCNDIFYAASLKTPFIHREDPLGASTDTGDNDTEDPDPKIYENHKVLYYKILDTILMQMNTRFKDMEKLLFFSLADSSKFDKYSKKFPFDSLHNLKQSYPNLFGFMELHRLKNELEIVYSDHQYRDKHLHEIIELLHKNCEIFKETYKLFCLILTIPSTNSTADGNFSCLKRIETFLRNSMPQQTLESLSCLGRISIEKELLSELQERRPFYEDIINKFAGLEDRSIDLICKQ